MKNFLKKISNFFTESNRLYHLIGGFGIMVAMMIAYKAVSPNYFHGAYVGVVATLLTMLSLEYKDWKGGGIFDWKDIVVGMVVPAIIWLALLAEIVFG